jgi:hypothetical protein
MTFTTGIKATSHFTNILGSVLGQMSDGIWENTRSMEKYWKSLSYTVNPDGYIVIIDNNGVCADPVDFFANKIKKIIQIEIEDGNHNLSWNRWCPAVPHYMHGTPTVGDCYLLYELLKGRDTSKHSYCSNADYNVEVELNGAKFTVRVEATKPSKAREKAIAQLAKQMVAKII